jgi:hypothetical protein
MIEIKSLLYTYHGIYPLEPMSSVPISTAGWGSTEMEGSQFRKLTTITFQ